MKDFCNMVGFPIVKHEAHCLTLFRLLEQECLKVVDDGCLSNLLTQGHEALGSLRGLFQMLIIMVPLLGAGVELLRMLWGLLVLNELTPSFLECKGA